MCRVILKINKGVAFYGRGRIRHADLPPRPYIEYFDLKFGMYLLRTEGDVLAKFHHSNFYR